MAPEGGREIKEFIAFTIVNWFGLYSAQTIRRLINILQYHFACVYEPTKMSFIDIEINLFLWPDVVSYHRMIVLYTRRLALIINILSLSKKIA